MKILKTGQVWKTRSGGVTTLTYDVQNDMFIGSLGNYRYASESRDPYGLMVFDPGIGEHGCDLVELVSE